MGPVSSDTLCALPCLDATWKALGFLDLSKPVVLFSIAPGYYLLVSEGVRVSFLKATYVLLAWFLDPSMSIVLIFDMPRYFLPKLLVDG